METAAFFARKHGLERYLDDPAELNSAIFKLLVLQEALQEEQARRSGGGTGAAAISVRRTVHGKFTASCSGDGAYRYAVEMALRAATTVTPLFQRGLFENTLHSMGVPGERIEVYSDSVVLSDDTRCIDPD
jgi:hypothetical protein